MVVKWKGTALGLWSLKIEETLVARGFFAAGVLMQPLFLFYRDKDVYKKRDKTSRNDLSIAYTALRLFFRHFSCNSL